MRRGVMLITSLAMVPSVGATARKPIPPRDSFNGHIAHASGKLVSRRGTLSLVASSPPVCGFTSPLEQGPCPSPPPAGA